MFNFGKLWQKIQDFFLVSKAKNKEKNVFKKKILERNLRDFMIPKSKLVLFDVLATVEQVMAYLTKNNFSKVLVYETEKDNIIKVLFYKDIVNFLCKKPERNLVGLGEEPIYVHSNILLSEFLNIFFKKKGKKLPVLVDEYGCTEGIISIKLLFLQLFNELFNTNYSFSNVFLERQNYQKIGEKIIIDGDFLVSKVKRIFSVEEIGFCPENTSVNGLLLNFLGRIPRKSEMIEHPSGLNFFVLEIDQRKISRVEVFLRKSKRN